MGKNEEVETLDLSDEIENKELNQSLEGTTEENIKEKILNDDLNQGIKHENTINQIMSEDNSVDNVYGEELVGLDNLGDGESPKPKKGKSLLPLIVILVILVVIALLCAGIYMWNNSNNEKLKNAMREPAIDYFDKYMSVGTGASAYTVTLKDLKEANNNGENYDLKSFDKCDDEKTEATIHIDYITGKASNVEIKLSCKIF